MTSTPARPPRRAGDATVLLREALACWDADLDRAARLLARARAEGRPEPRLRRELDVRLGAALFRLGRLAHAEAVLTEAPAGDRAPHAALQLGRVLRARGAAAAAAGAFEAARSGAREGRDLALAVAATTGLGELELDAGRPREAVARLGEALGLTEWARDERLTVAPLAALAEAHAAWRHPAKGLALARRAAGRAARAGDPVLRARAALALGRLEPSPDRLRDGERDAAAAPHRPLALRLRWARLELEPDPAARAETLAAARRMGLALPRERGGGGAPA